LKRQKSYLNYIIISRPCSKDPAIAPVQIISVMKEKPVSEKRDSVLRDNVTLVLINDEVNTFEHVIKSLVEVCGHDTVQAEQCAVITHFTGQCEVKTGSSKVINMMYVGLLDRNLNSEIKS